MRPSINLQRYSSRFTRILVLLGVLCLAGMPVLEAGHQHGVADNTAECLLCKSPALLALVAAAVVPALLAVARTRFWLALRPALEPQFSPRQSRGPPLYS